MFAGITVYSPLHRKGDYCRYLAEFKSGDHRKEAADESLKAYEVNLVGLFFVDFVISLILKLDRN